jgi:hypothetical protein
VKIKERAKGRAPANTYADAVVQRGSAGRVPKEFVERLRAVENENYGSADETCRRSGLTPSKTRERVDALGRTLHRCAARGRIAGVSGESPGPDDAAGVRRERVRGPISDPFPRG